MPPVKRPATPTSNGRAAFGSSTFYTQGGGIPEGDYAVTHTVQNFQATRQDGQNAGPSRLGVMVEAWPIVVVNGTAHLREDEPRTQFYSMGSKADQSFAPDPDTGKGIVPIPGGPASTLSAATNWALYRKSFEDSGLPEGVFVDSLEVLDGTWVHIQQVPEPEERKRFGAQAQTGEAVEEQMRQGPRTVGIITAILEGGAPWEGGGGVPTEKASGGKPAPAPKTVNATKPGPRPVAAKPAASAAPVVEGAVVGEDEEAVKVAAINAVSEVLSDPKMANGTSKLLLRTSVFKVLNAKSPEHTQAVTSSFFSSDDALNGLLGELGYKVAGAQISVI